MDFLGKIVLCNVSMCVLKRNQYPNVEKHKDNINHPAFEMSKKEIMH